MNDLLQSGWQHASIWPGRASRSRSKEHTWRWHRRTGPETGFQLRADFGGTKPPSQADFKSREHLDYLNRMRLEGVVTPALAHRARAVWWVARLLVGPKLPVPAAVAFAGGPIEYDWSAGSHRLSAEIPIDGPCHWTYRNAATGELWGIEAAADDVLPLRIVRALSRIAVGSR